MSFLEFLNFHLVPGIVLGSVYAVGAIGIVGTQHASCREHDTRKRGAVHTSIHNATHYCNLPVRYTPDTSRTRSTRSRNFIKNATCWA